MKGEDLTGKCFGKLQVLKKTERRENSYIVWECVCACGKKTDVNTKKLKRGTVTDCGCTRKNTARNGTIAENLTGQKFGYLTAEEKVESQGGRTRWKCKCKCGKYHIVATRDLKSGKCKSCGCYKRKTASGKMKNLTGKKFGRLTVLYATPRRDKRGSVMWVCQCECGNQKEFSESALVHEKFKSCGCMGEEYRNTIYQQLHMVDGTCVEFLEKRKNRKDNVSGFRGIVVTEHNKYKAYIGFQGKNYYLGSFDTFEEAKSVRLESEKIIHDGFVTTYYCWKRKAELDEEWGKNNILRYQVTQHSDRTFSVDTNIERNTNLK